MFEWHKKIYQHASKRDDQQKFKYISEAAMVSTPEEITDDSLIFPMTQTTFLVCLWPKWQSRNQVLGNNCVYSPTYLMLKRELLFFVLELQNKYADPLNLDVSCGGIRQNWKDIPKSMNKLSVIFIHG